MFDLRPRDVILFALLLGGCAAGRPEPSTQAATQTAAERDSRRAEELFTLGKEAETSGDVVRAEQYLSLAIDQGADRRMVMPILLRACVSNSHLRAALNYAEPYLLEHPNDFALRYLVANIHWGLGQVIAARRELGLLLRRDDQNPDAHYLLGIIDARTDIQGARRHFRAAMANSSSPEQRAEIRSRLAELDWRDSEASRSVTEEVPTSRLDSDADLSSWRPVGAKVGAP